MTIKNDPPFMPAYSLQEWETMLWAMSIVAGLDATPGGRKLVDTAVPMSSGPPPYRSERLQQFGQQVARDLEASQLLIRPS